MHFINYNRNNAIEYAKAWAKSRNDAYLNFDDIGGDCTNFASQCLYAGVGVMNYKRDVGWYYNTPDDRAAAWSGVEYFRRFLLNNKAEGPFAIETLVSKAEAGDFIQLSDADEYYHTLIVCGFSGSKILVCAHTDDAYMRPLDSYSFVHASCLHILGANKY